MGTGEIYTLLLLFFLILLIAPGRLTSAQKCPDERHVVVCYYASWGVYRPGNGTFKIEFIDPKLCTHVIYSFAGLNLDGLIDSLDSYNDITQGPYVCGVECVTNGDN